MTEHAEPREDVSDRTRAMLAGLADGTLSGRRRERAEARASAVPDADRLIARQRRVAGALRWGPVAPSRPTAPSPAPIARRWPVRPALAAAALAAASLAVVVTLLTLQGGAPSAPSLSLFLGPSRSANEAPPPPRAETPRLLDRSFAGVVFPDWGRAFGWKAVGARSDVIAGRRAETVYYHHQDHRIAYTVLDGKAFAAIPGGRQLDPPAGPVRLYPGDRARSGPHGGTEWMAVFERDGRTCVLAGIVDRPATLVKLASWRGRGAVRF